VPSPAYADPEAPSMLVRGGDTPLVLRVAAAAAITQQEQPDHPQSSVGALQETAPRQGLFTAPFGEGQFAEAILNEVPAAGSSPINDSTPGGTPEQVPQKTKIRAPAPPAPQVVNLEAGAGVYRVTGSDASMSVTLVTKGVKARARTKIGRAVLKNAAEIDLIGASFIALIDTRIESLRQTPPNSHEARAAVEAAISDYQDLKARVEAFLGTASQFVAKKASEKAVTEQTYSVAEGIRDWWSKRHVQICDKLFDKALQATDVALFGTVLGLCGLAGVEPNFTVAVSGTWFGGKGVADVIKATLVPAALSKAPAPRSKKGRR
jgi:hypothetical protein